MARSRTPLRLIEADRHRSYAFQRRKEALKKKTMELGELCGIVTLLVCFGPRGQLVTWPEDPEEVSGIIQSYRRVGLDGDGVKRRYALVGFFQDLLKRLQRELGRVRDAWLGNLPLESLEELMRSLDSRLEAVDESIVKAEIEQKKLEAPTTQFPQHQLPTVENLHSSTALNVQPLRRLDGSDSRNDRPERYWLGDAAAVDGLCHSPPGPSLLLTPVQGGCFDLGTSYLCEHLFCDFLAHSTPGDVFYPVMASPTNVCRYGSVHSSSDVGRSGVQLDTAPLFESSAFSFLSTEFATFPAAGDFHDASLRGFGDGGGDGGVHLPNAPSFEPFPISYLPTDFGTLPAAGDLGKPTMAFPLSFCLGGWDHLLSSQSLEEPSASSPRSFPRHLLDGHHSATLYEADALRGELADIWPPPDPGCSFVFPDPLLNALSPLRTRAGEIGSGCPSIKFSLCSAGERYTL
ncbi:unnamed protein product [Spirodela intermedia]|uniref:MADS-box domain-containing protein n=1 Tax=Spirodela intermedia TaxID=51605 RepID=A0A7I8J128_SPIIN|nr:unnamed protein product [Spirodela intermedia]CAA6663513.1 unnamed protein product [Spirodela intermedia]